MELACSGHVTGWRDKWGGDCHAFAALPLNLAQPLLYFDLWISVQVTPQESQTLDLQRLCSFCLYCLEVQLPCKKPSVGHWMMTDFVQTGFSLLGIPAQMSCVRHRISHDPGEECSAECEPRTVQQTAIAWEVISCCCFKTLKFGALWGEATNNGNRGFCCCKLLRFWGHLFF